MMCILKHETIKNATPNMYLFGFNTTDKYVLFDVENHMFKIDNTKS